MKTEIDNTFAGWLLARLVYVAAAGLVFWLVVSIIT